MGGRTPCGRDRGERGDLHCPAAAVVGRVVERGAAAARAAELGAAYAITRNLVVSVSPLVFAYSTPDAGLNDLVSSLTRYEILIGAGYRM